MHKQYPRVRDNEKMIVQNFLIVVYSIFFANVEAYRAYDVICGNDFYHNIELQSVEIKWCANKKCHSTDAGCYREDANLIEIGYTELIPTRAFYGLKKLRQIKGVNRKIGVLASVSFVDLPLLESIDLSFNIIRYIQHDIFVHCSATTLDLSWNKILFVEEHSFDGLPNLQKLDLGHNEIPVFFSLPRMSRLRELTLSYNFIERLAVSSKIYPNLTLLDLSFNRLELFALTSEIPMKRIDLTKNFLDRIDVFNVVSAEDLRISLNEFTLETRDRAGLNEEIYLRTKRISLYPNPWSCSVLSTIWKQLYEHNITLLESDDDYRIAKQSETFPVCLDVSENTIDSEEFIARLESFKELSVQFIKDKHKACTEDSMCSDQELCRNKQCFNPCQENVCDFTSLCRAKNHTFSCNCPRNQKRDPNDLYSRCYTAECFSYRDCPDYVDCNTTTHLCQLSRKQNPKFHIDVVADEKTIHLDPVIIIPSADIRDHAWFYDPQDPGLDDNNYNYDYCSQELLDIYSKEQYDFQREISEIRKRRKKQEKNCIKTTNSLQQKHSTAAL